MSVEITDEALDQAIAQAQRYREEAERQLLRQQVIIQRAAGLPGGYRPKSARERDFREMMERFEYQLKVEQIIGVDVANGPSETVVSEWVGGKLVSGSVRRIDAGLAPKEPYSPYAPPAAPDAETERFVRVHGCTPRTYIDRDEGLVPLPTKPEPAREVPEISAGVYAAMKRWA